MSKTVFIERMHDEWLKSFCNARDDTFKSSGFDKLNLEKLSEHDAFWFIEAIDKKLVTETAGFFLSTLSAAKEQIFWEGPRADNPRKLSLWLEPIITIGALARLVENHGWPQSQIGLQSKPPWPFDLVGYGKDTETELLACEVKKTAREVKVLLEEMSQFGLQEPLVKEPDKSSTRNAYRKVVGTRRSSPNTFWALGPDKTEHVFHVEWQDGHTLFSLNPVPLKHLDFERISLANST